MEKVLRYDLTRTWEGSVNSDVQSIRRKPALTTVEGFVRQQNIELLQRTLKAEIDPDSRRVIRRLLREQERMAAAVKAA